MPYSLARSSALSIQMSHKHYIMIMVMMVFSMPVVYPVPMIVIMKAVIEVVSMMVVMTTTAFYRYRKNGYHDTG